MQARAGWGTWTLGALLLAGCATGGETPRRPAVAVADDVTAVDRAAVVGTWQCRELNPYPEVPMVATTTTYRADGSFTSEGRSPARPPLGAVEIKADGHWSVEGGAIVTSDVKTEASSADAWTNIMAGAASRLVDTFGGPENRAAGEVLRLNRGELVLRPSGVEDPPIISCTRG